MHFKKIRIPVTDTNSTILPLSSSPLSSPLSPSLSSPLSSPLSPSLSSPLSSESASGDLGFRPRVKISTTPATVAGFSISRYFHPAAPVNINIPDADLPIVRTWLGAATSQQQSPSDTLTKRITDTVIGTFRTYLDRAAAHNLLTSPFLIGCALRRADGSHCNVSPYTKKLPNTRAPQLVVHEATLDSNSLQTITEIYNTPVSLQLDIEPFEIDPAELTAVTHLDIYLGKPVPLLDGHEQVTAIRTAQIAGENMKIWQYNRLAEDIVLSNLAATSDFRIIASIPIATAMQGVAAMKLPHDGVNLGNWNSIPKLDSDTKPGDIDTPQDNYTHKQILTTFLDLGDPEAEKRVRALSARGIFPRGLQSDTESRGEEIAVELLGSHHRDIWHTVARSRGPHIRLLRGCSFRWWQVRVTMPRDGRLDALTFEIG